MRTWWYTPKAKVFFFPPHNYFFRSYQGACFRMCVSKGDFNRYSDSCRTVVPIFLSFLIAALYQGRESFLQKAIQSLLMIHFRSLTHKNTRYAERGINVDDCFLFRFTRT